MNDSQGYQERVLRQLNSIKIAAWVVAISLVVCTVATLAVSLVAGKTLAGCSPDVLRPQYQRNLRELLTQGKYDDVLKVAAQKKTTNPADPYAWYSSGLAYYNMKDWTNALHDLREAQTLAPTWEKDYTGPYIKTIEGILSGQAKSSQPPSPGDVATRATPEK
jgi:cytochrome c-type biogenesis protein CcmH/NrfG